MQDFNRYSNVDDKNVGHYAVQFNAWEIVLFLKEDTHFDFLVKDRWNQSCLDYAQSLKFEHIENLIKDHIKKLNCISIGNYYKKKELNKDKEKD